MLAARLKTAGLSDIYVVTTASADAPGSLYKGYITKYNNLFINEVPQNSDKNSD